MATTTNYGWTTPDDTALVKDGASAIRSLGTSVDTTTKNLNPSTTLGDVEYRSSTANTNTRLGIGTSGQVLTVAGGVPSWSAGLGSTITTKGDLIVGTGSATFVRQGVGADGTVLTANSAQADGVEWLAPAAGGMTVIASGSLSGSSTTINSIAGTYNNLRLLIRNPRGSTDNKELYLQINGDTGTNYNYSLAREGYNVSANSSFLPMGFNMDNSVNNGTLFADFSDYANTSVWKLVKSFSAFTNATNNSNATYADYIHFWKSTSAITSITVYPDSGNWAGGTYVLYGVK